MSKEIVCKRNKYTYLALILLISPADNDGTPAPKKVNMYVRSYSLNAIDLDYNKINFNVTSFMCTDFYKTANCMYCTYLTQCI